MSTVFTIGVALGIVMVVVGLGLVAVPDIWGWLASEDVSLGAKIAGGGVIVVVVSVVMAIVALGTDNPLH